MLMPGEALEYELAVTFGGTLIMMIIQVVTGPIFTWLIWALAVAVVTLEYVDHVCVGWTRLLPSTQIRRVLWNALLCLGSGTGLYWTIVLLIPDVNVQDLRSILNAIQYTIRLKKGWGPFIYFAVYSQFYLCALSFFRTLINTGVVVWTLIHSTEWAQGQSGGRQGQGSAPPPAAPSVTAMPHAHNE